MNTFIWHKVLGDCVYFIRIESKQLLRYLGFCLSISVIFLAITYSFPVLEQNVLFLIIYMFAQIHLLCGTLIFIDSINEQQALSPWQALMTALPRLASFIGVSILTGVGVAVGFIFFIVPGIYLNARWLVADMCAVLAEKKRPLSAMTTSMQLTRGNSIQLCILVIINTMLLLSLVVATILGGQNPNLVVEFLTILLSWLVYFFWIIVRYRCYLLLRGRQKTTV